jgi:hypothetical protein
MHKHKHEHVYKGMTEKNAYKYQELTHDVEFGDDIHEPIQDDNGLPVLAQQVVRPSGKPIKELKINAINFLNKSTALYGKSNSGKSSVMRDILLQIREYVSMGYVFSMTEDQNDSFKDIVPRAAIFTDFSQDDVTKFIIQFWQRQKAAVKTYKRATQPSVLVKLYRRVAGKRDDEMLKMIRKYRQKIKERFDKKINKCRPEEKGYYETQQKQVLSTIDDTQVEFFRRVIKKHKKEINKSSLSKDEKYTLQYIGFRPHAVLVFDDCIHTFTTSFQNKAEFRSLFVMGRHNYITVILAVHLRSNLQKTINENVANAIFCSKSIAANTAENMDSSCRDEVREFQECIRTIYNPSEPFRKMCYISNCPDPFRWIIAEFHPFEPDEAKRKYIGSRYFVNYCKKVFNHEGAISKDNPFAEMFDIE